ncbi:MAG: polyprenyl synthetase family protein [Bacteroidota bacterium]
MKNIEQYTQLLEEEITKFQFPNSPENLYQPLQYFLSLGGKRIRPILTIMAAELFGKHKNDVLSAALAIEFFHNFSLIHDDIMDAAPLRRNKETVHSKWNSNIAILSGDVLFVQAYSLLAQQDAKHLPALLQIFNKTAIEVCEGQQLDMDFELRNDVSEEEYIEMIRLKTSVLLGCALELGAIISDTSAKNRQNIYDFGVHIGLAFQIKDDMLDLYGKPEEFGKQIGGDVISNKKTLLNLKAFNLANELQKEQLKGLVSVNSMEYKVEETRRIYDEIGVYATCEIEMQKHYELAMKALNDVDAAPSSKEALIALSNYLMVRNS